jgi:hypothetical protein
MRTNTFFQKGVTIGVLIFFLVIVYSPGMSRYDTAGILPVSTSYEPTSFDWGVDQKNTQNSGLGITLHPPEKHAQGFTPTKDKLTAVSLYLFQGVTPPDPVHITVTIRDNLTGSDMTGITLNTSKLGISKTGQWVLFDFGDISTTPGKMYYIVCSVDAGSPSHAYCWLFANNDTYPGGKAWFQDNASAPWNWWPSGSMYPVDFCFKTYFRKPITSPVLVQGEHHQPLWLSWILQRFTAVFTKSQHFPG